MNIVLWILQSTLAFVFLHAGLCKTFYRKRDMKFLGQDGVVGMPLWLIRTVGIIEILGAYGLVIPLWLNIVPILTPLAAAGFCIVMILAIGVNYRNKKYQNIGVNIALLIIFLAIFIGRCDFSYCMS
jgi:uncharacterized membrane protein YphA (DoxX/SURF4 family)